MKQIKELIKELSKTPRGKGILFFAFYFVVFIAIFIFLQFSDNTGYQEKEYELGREYSFDISYITKNNYHFKYIITKDNNKYIYEGDRYNDTSLFTLNNKKYYFDGDKYYLDDNGWKEVENPYLYPKFINIDNTMLLVEQAMLDSKTDYQSGNTKYNFLISSNTINEVLDNKVTDIDEVPNTITINNNGENIVDGVIYHLNSYCISNKSCNNSVEIDLNYENFGEIKKIVSPID